jgi:hypothetical protein
MGGGGRKRDWGGGGGARGGRVDMSRVKVRGRGIIFEGLGI